VAGAPLVLRREPHNPHDANAIEVFTADGAKLGYVPRRRNRRLAELMDAGHAFDARIGQINQGHGGAIGLIITAAGRQVA